MSVTLLDLLLIVFVGIIEGITEWLPVSSTGHMLLFDAFFTFNASEQFKEMFFIVIQFGAILAVISLFWKRLFPFQKRNIDKPFLKKDCISIWKNIIIACIPGAIITLIFDDWIEAHLHTPFIIALALIFFGFAFIFVENLNEKRKNNLKENNQITPLIALYIGLFQVLSIIPGTSRSGATIIGAMLVGVSRKSATEFTFYLSVPVMFGYSLLKIFKFGSVFTTIEISILLLGIVVAFVVSYFTIKLLMGYVKKHSFKSFGYYRIVLGTIILICLATHLL